MPSELRYDPAVYVSAARVRVTADRRLNRTTPDRILRLAAGDLGVVGTWINKKESDKAAEVERHPLHAAPAEKKAGEPAET